MSMTSRERVNTVLNHKEADRVPLDLGGSAVTGMHVSSVYMLRQALALDAPGTPVKVVEPYQMLGEISPDLVDALGIDVISLGGPRTMFGFRNEYWKEWSFFDGTPVLVPEEFNTIPEPNGDILMYPEGDRNAQPSGRLPKEGFYFDTIIRQQPIDEATLCVEDNMQEFTLLNENDLAWYRSEARRLSGTDKAVLASFGGTAFGDIALVPGQWLKQPRGIRDITEWYTSALTRRDFVYELFSRQCDIGLANLDRIHGIVGDLVTAVFVTGTDFGTQHGPFISPDVYRDLYLPFHKRVNDWMHKNTTWKSFIHSCGSVRVFLDDFVEAGFDILNPVQCSACGMDAQQLKDAYGDRLSFWGGGIDTQHILPFGTPEEVAAQVRERVRIFGKDGGFIFNAIHNVQAGIPLENLIALYTSFNDCR